MMPVTNYTVMNGVILGENRGGVKRDYVPDPLGSTVALLDNTQTKTDTFSYWPYGETKNRTGTTATPFQFVGTLGYYRDTTGRTYVRARTLHTDLGRWQTEDPIGLAAGDANMFGYVEGRVVTWVDPSGMQVLLPPRECRRRFPANPNQCFNCVYFYQIQKPHNPADQQMACQLANRYCGSSVNCNKPPKCPPVQYPGGPLLPPPPTDSLCEKFKLIRFDGGSCYLACLQRTRPDQPYGAWERDCCEKLFEHFLEPHKRSLIEGCVNSINPGWPKGRPRVEPP